MPKRYRSDRRTFLGRAGVTAAALAIDGLRPAWARSMQVTQAPSADTNAPIVYDLAIREQAFDIAGGRGNAMTINDSVPGPLLEWQEGRDVVLNVSNHMRQSTSIHWHGILLPFEMDGVPGVAFRGIEPGSTFQYRFPVKQSGTYWYHSHTGLQEQSGVYGPLRIHPKAADPVRFDRDYVVMLSDWTFEDPHNVMAKLKKMSDYYNYQQFTQADLYGTGGMSAREAWAKKLAWDRMRMMPSDIADITGATYTYLMNGLHPAGNWTGIFARGERVRLRFINGSSMSYFNVRIPGLPMTVVSADGQNVQPVEIDEFQIGVAETYDVIVEPGADDAYTIMAESMDRSGYAAGTLATRPELRAAIPPLRERPLLTMVDMGMAMEGMDMKGMDMQGSTGPIIARHGPDTHGPGNLSIAQMQRDRLGERGTGLAEVEHRVLVYRDLTRLDEDYDDRPPAREIELHLTGHMERYMWSFDGKQFHEVDGPIDFHYGERLRLTMVNDTMMNHPIHLHGMWMELENGHGRRIPRKHTLNLMPGSRLSALISADAPGRWAFHCHLLYHMDMGMFRVVRVSDGRSS
tara:strand:+ start:1952 stop:3673 length:1722 start_codon:yes stop_codon:yes gene_type:complete